MVEVDVPVIVAVPVAAKATALEKYTALVVPEPVTLMFGLVITGELEK